MFYTSRAIDGPVIDDGEEILLTLFVGAIGPQATEESLAAHFETFGKVDKVKIILDWVTKQSKECALVYFISHEGFKNALKQKSHCVNGRTIRVEPADRSKKGTKKMDTVAMLVTQIDYSTPQGEIVEYFAAYGTISSCKFFKNATEQCRSKSAVIRFEKPAAIHRILEAGIQHLISGKLVSCGWYNNSLDFGSDGSELPSLRHQPSSIIDQPGMTLPASYETPSRGPAPSASNQRQAAHMRGQLASHYQQTMLYFEDFQSTLQSTQAQDFITPAYKSEVPAPLRRPSFVFALEYERDELFAIFCSGRH